MSISKILSEKSVQAALAAIEIYNKPDFSFREEAFSLLMVNAWELLLKAKWTKDNNDKIESIYIEKPNQVPISYETNRSGGYRTISAGKLALKLLHSPGSNLEKPCYENIMALIEIRDNSAHLYNRSRNLGKRILEIGTASLQNYMLLSIEWFDVNFENYNFFLMPISFYHGFEVATPAFNSPSQDLENKLLKYFDNFAKEHDTNNDINTSQRFAIKFETTLKKGSKKDGAIPFRLSKDSSAHKISIDNSQLVLQFPYLHKDLMSKLKKKIPTLKINSEFYEIIKIIKDKNHISYHHPTNLNNPNGPGQWRYNENVFSEFEKLYNARRRSSMGLKLTVNHQ